MNAPRLLAAAQRRGQPWKNGGGVTFEIAAHPEGAGLESFDWRVSSAQVASAGPFSRFPGVDRILCVLEGELSLSIAGAAALALDASSEPLRFPGDVPAHGVPRGAAVLDLNVMTRRDRCRARVHSHGPGTLVLGAGTSLVFARAPLRLAAAGWHLRLAAGDAARFDGAGECTLSADTRRSVCELIEFFPATP